MICRQCRGTGKVIIDDTGLGYYLKEGTCPFCNGKGFQGVESERGADMPFSFGDILLWGISGAVCWGVAGCLCALSVYKPVGSMIIPLILTGVKIGAGAGIFALFSFFGIYSLTGDMSKSYGLHLSGIF